MIIDCVVDEGTKPLGQLLVGLDAVATDPIHPAPFARLSRTTLVRSGARRWGDLAQKTPDDLRNIRHATDVGVRDIIGICIDMSLEVVERESPAAAPVAAPPRNESTGRPDALSAPEPGAQANDARQPEQTMRRLASPAARPVAPESKARPATESVAGPDDRYDCVGDAAMIPTLLDVAPFLRRYGGADGVVSGVSVTADLSEVVRSPDWKVVRQRIVGWMLEEHFAPIGQLLPAMQLVRSPLDEAPLHVRSKNILLRANIHRWEELAATSPAEILSWTNAGTVTVRDLLAVCLDAAATAVVQTGVLAPPSDAAIEVSVQVEAVDGSPVGVDRPSPDDPRMYAVMEATRSLRVIAAWATERGLEQIGEALRLVSQGQAPPDVIATAAALEEIDSALLATRSVVTDDMDALIEELMAPLAGGQRVAFERRVIDGDVTLEEVGAEMGITRERVRQLQAKAEEEITRALAGERFRSLRWRAWELAGALGRAAPSDSPVAQQKLEHALRGSSGEHQRVLRAVLLDLAGPYRERDGWLVRRHRTPLDAGDLRKLADEHGLLPLLIAKQWLYEQGIRPEFQDRWMADSARFRREGDTLLLWSGGAVGKCVALLALHGEPMDAESLVALVGEGHNYRGVRNGFLEDPRMMRVTRSLWGLRAWGMEEYSGIAEEIVQRIEEWGGRAKLQRLIDEMVPLFEIRESSVRAYAQAPMFVQEDGWVRLRRDDEPFEVVADVAGSRGVFLHEQGVSVAVAVDVDVLRGSGHSFPPAASAILGVLPGGRRSFSHAGGSLLVSWPSSSCLGPTMGSSRLFAQATGAVAGDYLRLSFDTERETIEATRVPASALNEMNGAEFIAALSGIPEGADPEAALALALGVPAAAVRRVLADRGDGALARLLPAASTDAGLDAALSELASLLDGG